MTLFVVLGYIFVFVLAVQWFLLPFAVFGVKEKLDTLISLQNTTNALLEQSLQTTEPMKKSVKVDAKIPKNSTGNDELLRRLDKVLLDKEG